MIDDVQAILYAVRDVIETPDFNTTQIIVDFMKNTSVEAIDYDHATIHALIETVFALNYLSDFEGVIYDTLEEMFADPENAEDLAGEWQAVAYEAYEEESDYTFIY